MIEELKAFFHEFLEKSFKELNIRIDNLEKQIAHNKKEQQSLNQKSDSIHENFTNLKYQFQSLLEELNSAQTQANQIIDKISSQKHFNTLLFQNPLNNFNWESNMNYQEKTEDLNNIHQNYPQGHKQQPINPKKVVQNGDIIVYKTITGKKYHQAGCEFLACSKIPTTIREAMKIGMAQCKICLG
ncbi:unnamed protein product [Paramecium sonneborni]|uniref:Uncharacterized protein n=1 Tax=Paramecium sonneborni TaxID=65129 RepID=A0A8S1PYC4_9CILI|nr:unnamed protein product [Paramecium sonneborni]